MRSWHENISSNRAILCHICNGLYELYEQSLKTSMSLTIIDRALHSSSSSHISFWFTLSCLMLLKDGSLVWFIHSFHTSGEPSNHASPAWCKRKISLVFWPIKGPKVEFLTCSVLCDNAGFPGENTWDRGVDVSEIAVSCLTAKGLPHRGSQW